MKPPAGRGALGALLGLVTAGVAVGVGELVAAFVRPASSPIIVVGNRTILLTPEPVRRWAIRSFGTHDKTFLLTGIYLGIALLAVAVGVLAVRRLVLGLLGVLAAGVFAAYCAETTHAHRATDVIPSFAAAVAGLLVLAQLFTFLQPRPEPAAEASGPLLDRRQLLLATSLAAGIALVTGFGGRALQRARSSVSAARAAVALPPVAAPAPAAGLFDLGHGPPFQTAAADFYRIDTALTVPQIDPATWRLRIHGMVEHELTLSYDDLLAMPAIERWVTLACVSNEVGGNLVGNARFQGVRLADLLTRAGIASGADQLVASSADGMTIGSPVAVVMDGRDALLAYAMNGEPLPVEHGFPVRMVVPGLFGYVSACKWIVDLKATTFPQEQAYWVDQGWAAMGPVLLTARIDRPRDGDVLKAGAPFALAGVAWDQHVGVSKVEVKVDDGDWVAATLASVPSTDSWRQWYLPGVAPAPGKHTVTVRATDAKGVLQTSDTADPFPSGSTGLHSIGFRTT